MKRLFIVFIAVIALLIQSCATHYCFRARSGFYQLERGMKRSDFVRWVESSYYCEDGKATIGGRPLQTKTFKHGNDVWEVWVFEIYRNNYGNIELDRYEYMGIKNGLIEEWGDGTMPITLR